MSEFENVPDPSVGIPQAIATAIGEFCMHWSELLGIKRMPLWRPTTGAMLVWLENAVRTLALSASEEHKREILIFDPKRRCRPGRRPTSEKWDDRQMRKQKHEEVASWYEERYGGAPKDFLEHQRELSERGRANVSVRWNDPNREPAKPRTKGEITAKRLQSKARMLRLLDAQLGYKVGEPIRVSADLFAEAARRILQAGAKDPSIWDTSQTFLEIEIKELTMALQRHTGLEKFLEVQVDMREVIASLPSTHGPEASAGRQAVDDPGAAGTDGSGDAGLGPGA